MNLTPEQMDQGRRNFLRVLAGTPAVAALGVTAALRGPVPGGPVRVGFLCVGSQGRTLLSNVDPAYAQVVALCDINPTSLARADEVLKNNGQPPAKHYEDWKEMLQKENIEAVYHDRGYEEVKVTSHTVDREGKVLGAEPPGLAAGGHLGAGPELDRRVHHHPALPLGEGGDVGPGAGEVEAHRGGKTAQDRRHGFAGSARLALGRHFWHPRRKRECCRSD